MDGARSAHVPLRWRAITVVLAALFVSLWAPVIAWGQTPTASPVVATPAASPDLSIAAARVRLDRDLDVLIFEQQVRGTAGGTVPVAHGAMDGAPVLAYVVPTTLEPTAAGFKEGKGILALTVTVHPDFDDTPLWDENGDGIYDNDGVVYHTHWVVLVKKDERVPGGLAVQEIKATEAAKVLPPTAPGMPLYLDSPGFHVQLQGPTLRVVVPVDRVRGATDFHYDAVTAYLQVNMSDPGRPVLGVYAVYSVLSGDLSLPYTVQWA